MRVVLCHIEERLARFHGAIHVVERSSKDLLIDGFHPFDGEWARVLAGLLAPRAEARIRCWIVRRGRLAVEDAARPKLGKECWVLGIIHILRFLLGIHVIEVAEEFIEAKHRRQEFVAIAEMVLAIFKSHVAESLEQIGERGLRMQSVKQHSWLFVK